MLPADFHWAPRYQYDRGANAIHVLGVVVAYMDQRVDGSWFARLDVLSGGPPLTRACSSVQQGRAGCEAWVARHADRLRVAAAERVAKQPMRPWMPRESLSATVQS